MYYLLYPATYLPVSLPTYLPNACLPASFLRDLLGLLILMFIYKYLLIFRCFSKGDDQGKKHFIKEVLYGILKDNLKPTNEVIQTVAKNL